MATSAGPNIVRDGLVFGYDTGEYDSLNAANEKYRPHKQRGKGNRFYKGRPITNFIAYQNAAPQSSYTSYSATSLGSWDTNHPGAIRAYNAQGTDITGYPNTGVTDWTNTHHAHWVYDEELGKPVVVLNCFDSEWKAKSFDCNTAAWSTYGMSTDSSYVISWLQWTTDLTKTLSVGIYSKNTSGTRNFYDGRTNSSTTTAKNTKLRTWQRVYAVFTISAAHDETTDYQRIYMYGHSNSPNGAGITVKVADVQLELNTDHPSAYLDSISTASLTTRSSTQSLVDLKKTVDIDVSNVSFDSTGRPTFDGTDDYFTTSGLSIGTPSSVSFETIIKFDGTLDSNDRKVFHWDKTGTTNGVAQIRKGTNNGRLMYQHHNGTTWYTLSVDDVVTADTYIHILVVHDSTTATMYKNGVQVGTGGVGNLEYTNAGEILIGYRAGSDYWKGHIPIFRVYNSALSADEVQQNYNAYKKRFEL